MKSNPLTLIRKQNYPLIIDGGLGSELEVQGYNIGTSLWSAELLIHNPQALFDVHLAYLEAGAQCITSASYQASVAGFAKVGLSEQRANELMLDSIKIARKACRAFLTDHPECGYRPLVAASIGPYGACLADGSEYRGDYKISDQMLAQFHRQRLSWLDQSDADILACETIPSMQEARVLRDLLTAVETPAWVSFSCCDESHLNDGNNLTDAIALFAQHPKVVALGVNCTAPQYIEALIVAIKSVIDTAGYGEKDVVVYPNSGEHYNAVTKTWSGTQTPLECGAASRLWAEAGATIIGGCCRMGASHIRSIADQLHSG